KSIFFAKQEQIESIKSDVFYFFGEIKKQYNGVEEGMAVDFKKIENFTNNEIINKNVQGKFLDLLYIFPNGPIAFHPKYKNLMFSSTNLGKIRTKDDFVKLRWLHRSLSKYYNNDIYNQVLKLLDLSGLEMENTYRGSYPPWEPNFNSKLLKIAQEAYHELFNEEAGIKIIHGGLEATLLIDKIPGVDAIAFGAKSKGLHSPDERLEIKSVERTWNFLLTLLKKFD
ncbi:MAG: M20/M25/M40 family metallo-hydrolase, partial [Candidatus Lokiarchaeia archaeon]|nr:M20/M25/M40 family metallo-hydrolase [Candidatus Lokiarchaeia archaeon]